MASADRSAHATAIAAECLYGRSPQPVRMISYRDGLLLCRGGMLAAPHEGKFCEADDGLQLL
jgi:hypothetical protein